MKSTIIALITLLMPAASTAAQWTADDSLDVLLAAFAHVRAEVPAGPLLLDGKLVYDALSPTLSNRLARQLGAERGRVTDAIQCAGVATTRSCRLERLAAAIGFSRPRFEGESVTVTVVWQYQGTPAAVAMKWRTLKLEKVDAAWRVTAVTEIGVS